MSHIPPPPIEPIRSQPLQYQGEDPSRPRLLRGVAMIVLAISIGSMVNWMIIFGQMFIGLASRGPGQAIESRFFISMGLFAVQLVGAILMWLAMPKALAGDTSVVGGLRAGLLLFACGAIANNLLFAVLSWIDRPGLPGLRYVYIVQILFGNLPLIGGILTAWFVLRSRRNVF